MKEVRCLVAFVVSLFVLGSLGVSTYAVADPNEKSDGLILGPAPPGAEDLVPNPPESPPLHREISMGGGGSEGSGGQGQPEGGGGGGVILQTVDWPDGHTCVSGFPETYEDETINLGGNLIIEPDCTLTFINTDMFVDELVRQVKIDVQASGGVMGTFEILSGSSVSAENTYYKFEVSGELEVSGSEIIKLEEGLKFFSSSIGSIVSSSTIAYSTSHVIYATNPHTLNILSSTVKNSGGSNTHGIYVDGGEANVYIYDSDVHSNVEYGIYVYGDGPKLIPEPIPLPPIPGTRFGYFVWVTETDWHIEWSTINGTSATFNGTVRTPTSNYSFNDTMSAGGGSANYAVEDTATFDLWVNGSRIDEDLIFVGEYEENPDSNPFQPRSYWMRVKDSDIHNNWGGIYVENSSPQIRANDIYSNLQYGVAVKEASPAIDRNDIKNNEYGIYAISDSSHSYSWSYSPIVYLNYVYVTGAPPQYDVGMLFDGYSYPRVRYNSIDGDFEEYALGFKTYSNGVANGNNVTRISTYSTMYGIYIFGSSPDVYDNNVEHISYGIIICYYSASEITANHVWDSWLGIYMYSSGSSGVTISYNHVDNSTRGIDLRASTADVISNTVRENEYGIVARENNYPLIKDNTVRWNTRDGILLYDNSDATVKGNTVTDNTWSGICLCPYPTTGYDDPGQPTIGGDTSADENKLYDNGRWGIELTYNEPTNSAKDDNYFEDNGDGWVVQYWWLDVTVKKSQGQQFTVVEGATVELREYGHYSDQDPYWSGLTDGNGETGKIKLREYYVGNNGVTIDCTPHQVYAYKDNKEGYGYPTMGQNIDNYEVIIS